MVYKNVNVYLAGKDEMINELRDKINEELNK